MKRKSLICCANVYAMTLEQLTSDVASETAIVEMIDKRHKPASK